MTPEQRRYLHLIAALTESYALTFARAVIVGADRDGRMHDQLDTARMKLVDAIVDMGEAEEKKRRGE